MKKARYRDRAHAKHPSRVSDTDSRLKLKELAEALNDLGAEPPLPRSALRRKLLGPTPEEILFAAGELLDVAGSDDNARLAALERFNSLALEVPVAWVAEIGPDGLARLGVTSTVSPSDSVGAFGLLAHALLGAGKEARRLKRCAACRKWFLDVTLGNRKLSCSSRCAERLKKRRQRANRRTSARWAGQRGSMPRRRGRLGYRQVAVARLRVRPEGREGQG